MDFCTMVGDEAILRSDVEKHRLEFGSTITGNPYCVIPEQLAIQKLFLHQAAIDSIEVTDAEINQYVDQEINQRVMIAGSKEKLEEYEGKTDIYPLAIEDGSLYLTKPVDHYLIAVPKK